MFADSRVSGKHPRSGFRCAGPDWYRCRMLERPFSRRALFALAATGASQLLLSGCSVLPFARHDSDSAPLRAQPGKDVMWIPTPEPRVRRMLQLAGCGPEDRVVDLGSGDGAIVFAAARDCGATALGIEYDPGLVEHARRVAEAAGLANRVQFEKADLFEVDFSEATIVTMYLQRHLNLRLRHRLMALRPGTRVVSHEFDLGAWRPDETSRVGTGVVHLWIVPTNAGGEWALRIGEREGSETLRLRLRQRYQDLLGTASIDDAETSIRGGRVEGRVVRFAFTDRDGRLLRFEGRVDTDRITGTVRDGRAEHAFSGLRIGLAPSLIGASPATEVDALDQPGEAR